MAFTFLLYGIFLYPRLAAGQTSIYIPERGTTPAYNIPLDTSVIMQQMLYWEKKIKASPDTALQALQELFRASRHISFYDGLMQIESRIGLCYLESGNYSKALELYREGFQYLKKTGSHNPLVIFSLYSGIAYVFQRMGQYDSSFTYLHQGLTLLQQQPDKNQSYIAQLYNNFAAYWLNLSDFKKTSYYLEKGIVIALKTKNKKTLSRFYQKKSILLFRQQKMEAARQYYHLALREKDSLNMLETADFISIWAALLHVDKRYNEALYNYKMALRIQQRMNQKGDVLRSYQSLATLYFHIKDFKRTAFFIEQALQGYKTEPARMDYVTALEKGAQLYAAMGAYKEAYKIVTKGYIPVKETLLSLEKAKNIDELDIKYKTLEKDKQIAETRLLLSKQVAKLREKNFWMWSMAGGSLLLSAFLLSAFRSNKRKKHLQEKQLLLLKKEQQIAQLRAVMQGEEQERARLARELHDGVGGMLAAIKMNISVVQLEEGVISAPDALAEVMQLVEGTADEVRKTAHNLMPDILQKHDLPQALRMYCDSLNTGGALQIDLHFHSTWKEVDPSFELSLYRILQELVQNIIKHAYAHHAVVQFREDNNTLQVLVEDDGTGFEEKEITAGLGLRNIRSRVAALQGHVSIESARDRGTTCSMELPIPYKKERL